MYAESSQVEYSFFEIFQIVDLQVFALPRITLKPLVPTFPCFAKILVSLMEKVWQLIIRLNYSGVLLNNPGPPFVC